VLLHKRASATAHRHHPVVADEPHQCGGGRLEGMLARVLSACVRVWANARARVRANAHARVECVRACVGECLRVRACVRSLARACWTEFGWLRSAEAARAGGVQRSSGE
jgi:hypothetical protein